MRRKLRNVVLLAALAVGTGFTHPSSGFAQVPGSPTIDLHWDRPDGPYKRPFRPEPVDLYVTLRGQREPIVGLQIWLVVTWDIFRHPGETGGGPLPPAWRFDVAGCQAGRLCLQTRQLAPYLSGPLTGFTPAEISFVQHEEDPGRLRVVMAERYETAAVLPPEGTFTVLRVRFDHTFSVAADSANPVGTCEGAAEWLHLGITRASYFNPDGVETPLAIGQEFLYWNPPPWVGVAATPLGELASVPGFDPWASQGEPFPHLPQCDTPVPSRTTTWGRLKSSYR